MAHEGFERRSAIAAMGRAIRPEMLAQVQAMFREEQEALATAPSAADLAYGDDERQRLDIYAPAAAGVAGAPVLLWVHGGGFVRGEKRSPDHPYNAHVGAWAARMGMVGAVMDYRLAPAHRWPAGGEDVGAAIDWLHAHAADHGGDPSRIVVMGTSAGAVHVATRLRLRPDAPGVAGMVLLSGLYGFAPLEERDEVYYGAPDLHADRCPRAAVVETGVPLLVGWAEHDPPRFQAEAVGLLAARLERHGAVPRAFCGTGHNHFSLACHIGGPDRRLADEVCAFVQDVTVGEKT